MLEGVVEEADFRWAHAVLRSRGHSVRLKTVGGAWKNIWGLVPLADLLNMGENETSVNVDCGTRYLNNTWGLNGTFRCTARHSLKKDEPLLSEYISKREHRTGAVLLREYGFVSAENGGLSFLPSDCHKLHFAVHVRHVEELERHVANPEVFLADASKQNSLLPMKSSVNGALKLLAQNEGKLLLDLSREHERRQLPKIFYDLWRSRSDVLLAKRPSNSKAEELLRLLRDPELLHTIAWDQALWDAGKLLLSDWDDTLAAELLFSHHDFPPELEKRFRHRRQQLLRASKEDAATR